jgi:hypothetical protein
MKVVNNNFFSYAEYATYGAFLGLALSKWVVSNTPLTNSKYFISLIF